MKEDNEFPGFCVTQTYLAGGWESSYVKKHYCSFLRFCYLNIPCFRINITWIFMRWGIHTEVGKSKNRCFCWFWRPYLCPSMESMAGLEIIAGERTMSSLIGKLTGQPFILLVMLTGHIQSYWKWNALINFHAVQLFQLLSVCSELLCIAKLWSESWVKCN